MHHDELQWAAVDPLDPTTTPFPPVTYATSEGLGWGGLAAIRFHNPPDSVVSLPPMTHHTLVLFRRPPGEFGVDSPDLHRSSPPPADTVVVVPAGRPARWRWRGRITSLHVFLEPGVVERTAAEAFGIDPAKVVVPAVDAAYLPPLRAAMLAVGDELTSSAAGGGIVSEALANLLAVHLVRYAVTPRVPKGKDGRLPRTRLNKVVEFVETHLDADLTLARMAAVAGLSVYHFARQFRTATGETAHDYVVRRRVERARELLRAGKIPLAEVAAVAGFADQSQFTRHFKRVVGVTPGRFRTSVGHE